MEGLRDHFFQQGSMAAANMRPVSRDKPGLAGGFQFCIPQCGLHVASSLGKQNGSAGFQSAKEHGEERTHGRHFMHDRKGKREIDRAGQVCESHRVRLNQADIHSLHEPGLCESTFESVEHLGLDVQSYNSTRRIHQTIRHSQFQ